MAPPDPADPSALCEVRADASGQARGSAAPARAASALTLPLVPSDAALLALQAGVVAAPRQLDARSVTRLRRLRGRGWALIPLASILGVILAIRYASATADWLTYLAVVAVPILAGVTLGWTAHGARPWLAPLAGGLFLVAWRTPGSLGGEAAAALLSGLSCVTLGVLMAAITPSGWLKLGLLGMAAADVWLTVAGQLQAPNAVLIAARPGGGLPQLQSEQFGSISMGYGDLFVAALLGSVWASRARVQRAAAGCTLVAAALFDLLFLVTGELPATVPVAIALLIVEAGLGRGRLRGERGVSGCCAPSRREDGIPPPAT